MENGMSFPEGETILFETVTKEESERRTDLFKWAGSIRCVRCHWPDETIRIPGEVCGACQKMMRVPAPVAQAVAR
jgi:hypothetical protein